MNMEAFWYPNNVKILFQKDGLLEFYPTKQMSHPQRLNALTRLSIYIGIVLFLYTGKSWTIYIPLIGMLGTILLNKQNVENFTSEMEKKVIYNDKYDPETDTKQLKKNRKCTVPTKENPFMNVLMNEWVDDPARPEACVGDEVEKNEEEQFGFNLYKDINDIFNKNNSQRQFFTMPHTTIPNDQGNFAKWLYQTPQTCKENGEACMRYEDVRQGSRPTGDYENNPLNV